MAIHLAGAFAAPTADGLEDLLAVVTYGAQKHPSLQAVEAATLELLAALLL